MNQRRNAWVLGALLTASLLISAPSLAGTKSAKGRIPAVKVYRVIQITARDVAPARQASIGREGAVRQSALENSRTVVLPNPDAQRTVVLPNPDAQRTVVLPNPDAQ